MTKIILEIEDYGERGWPTIPILLTAVVPDDEGIGTEIANCEGATIAEALRALADTGAIEKALA